MNQTSLTVMLLMLSVTLAPPAEAQFEQFLDGNSRNSIGMPIPGKVTSSEELELSLLRIQVMDIGSRRVFADMPLGIHGTFQLPPLPIGIYELRVLGQAGDVRYSHEFQSAISGFLTIQLPSRKGSGGQNAISALRLMHETPKKARKEIEAAAKELKKGARPKAIEHLEAAAVVDPDNFDVASNLGALYLQELNPDKAFVWLEKAHRIDPADSVNHVNLSAYYANRGQYAEAEKHAKEGLRGDPMSVRGQFMLAVSLVQQGKDVDYAKQNLARIQNQFTPARNLLNQLISRQ